MYPVRRSPPPSKTSRGTIGTCKKHAPSPHYADEWFDTIQEAIVSLSELPLRFGLAPENGAFEEEIRHRIVRYVPAPVHHP